MHCRIVHSGKKKWKQCSLRGEWLNNLWYTHIVGNCTAIKKSVVFLDENVKMQKQYKIFSFLKLTQVNSFVCIIAF